ncbi:protein DMP2 [Aristolochia californica]|uniref:protein DMP2 n=1 Tax=Aristolochia californica TaxID=171875 RepID=UPI0035DD921E
MAPERHQFSSSASAKATQKSMGDRTLTGVGNLIKLLPTGTVFIYQFLSPLLTNYGHCSTINKYLTGALLLISGFSCCFSSFTDSYTGSDGRIYYGIATVKGLWAFSDANAKSLDLSKYKLQLGDFVHAFFSLFVFAVLGVLDPNTVGCYYPSLETSQKTLLMSLPAAVGAVSSSVFMVFPNKRHGIGYPSAADTTQDS